MSPLPGSGWRHGELLATLLPPRPPGWGSGGEDLGVVVSCTFPRELEQLEGRGIFSGELEALRLLAIAACVIL